MDYIRFSVDGQRLDYDRKYYSSTDTIDTLYCNFKFETDDLGHILGGWDLPYLWAQFHDEEGNVYIKAVTDNTCSIPHNCLKQLKFKMTLFATDTEDYMTCKKRYTTNEIAFKFKGRANINYDGGVSPDEPVPSQWEIILDRVNECESNIEGLSQDVSAMGDRVDACEETVNNMSQSVASIESTVDECESSVSAMQTTVNGLDGRITANTNSIDTLSQSVTSMHDTVSGLSTSLDTEVSARETADTNLEGLITDETNNRINSFGVLQYNIDFLMTKYNNFVNGGAGSHSSIYRGKYLGNTYTDEQKEAIANGTFDDLFVGDYWTINGVNWRIADFDYYYNVGPRMGQQSLAFNKHHVVVVPDSPLYNAHMSSDESSVEGCYAGSEMCTTNLDDARTAFDNAFGSSFIPSHLGLYSNRVEVNYDDETSVISGQDWRYMRVELMGEEQVYGHAVWGSVNHNGFDVGTQKTQFKLFALDQTKINIGEDYWLTNVVGLGFAMVNSWGMASYYNGKMNYGVRPFACVVGDSE